MNDQSESSKASELNEPGPEVPTIGNDAQGTSESQASGWGPNYQQSPYSGQLRFFDWIRSLGIVRQPGWIGGVSAGLAYKFGIDVALMRGILVVLALLGTPALLAYAIAWALLPDTTGKIHLEELLRGNPELPLLGVGLTLLLGLSAFGRGIWPGFFGFNFSFFGGFWSTIASLTVIAGVIVGVYFLSRSLGQGGRPPSNYSGPAAAASGNPWVVGETVTPGTTTTAPQQSPPQHPVNANADQMAEWRIQQEAWRNEHNAWKEAQSRDREAWNQARRAEAQERRRATMEHHRRMKEAYRLRNPRLPAALIFIILGMALIIGALVSFTIPGPERIVLGIAVSAAVLALGMVIAALCGRKTASLGFFSFLAILTVVFGSVFSGLIVGGVPEQVMRTADIRPTPYEIPIGQIYVNMSHLSDNPPDPQNNRLTIKQNLGQLHLYLPTNTSVEIRIKQTIGSTKVNAVHSIEGARDWLERDGQTLREGTVSSGFALGEKRYHIGDPQNPEFYIVIEQSIGNIIFEGQFKDLTIGLPNYSNLPDRTIDSQIVLGDK
ncbi:MAG: PspC domain-containing protein [Microbacteriaceae bacterium]